MRDFLLYPLKDLLEDFYIAEIANKLNIQIDSISYLDSETIMIGDQSLETLLSAIGISKKEIFINAEGRVLNYLRTFKCTKNIDVQDFLHSSEKAIRMQKESATRTYLVLDSDNDEIAAYFAISIKPVILCEDHKLSKTKKKKLQVHSLENSKFEVIVTLLIGQIGRSELYSRDDIDLKMILNFVFGILLKVRDYIGGRVILVEVDKSEKLISHYEKYGFEKIQVQDDLTQLMQFVGHY